MQNVPSVPCVHMQRLLVTVKIKIITISWHPYSWFTTLRCKMIALFVEKVKETEKTKKKQTKNWTDYLLEVFKVCLYSETLEITMAYSGVLRIDWKLPNTEHFKEREVLGKLQVADFKHSELVCETNDSSINKNIDWFTNSASINLVLLQRCFTII